MTIGSLPRALIFDFDGLICDTEGCLLRAGQQVFAARGVELPFHRWLHVVGTSSPANFWVPWLEELTGDSFDETELLAEFEKHNLEGTQSLTPNDGVLELLDLAEANEISLAVASSSSLRWVGGLLDHLGLRSRFAHVLTRDVVEHAKPAPDLYLAAADRLGVNPAACIAFEDSHNGALAAQRAGIRCVVVPNDLTQHQDLSHATVRLSTLASVSLEMLRSL
jgi:HAD superfamily hydrolase (TIGR01509 family)